jgi:hypothetical protein
VNWKGVAGESSQGCICHGRQPFRPRPAARASATAGSKHGDGMTDPGTTDETRQTRPTRQQRRTQAVRFKLVADTYARIKFQLRLLIRRNQPNHFICWSCPAPAPRRSAWYALRRRSGSESNGATISSSAVFYSSSPDRSTDPTGTYVGIDHG